MIEALKRKAIYLLHKEGMSIRQISRRLQVGRQTVKRIIAQKGEMPIVSRKNKIELDPALLVKLYNECDGRIQRIHEKLIEEEKITIGYSTLSRILQGLNLGIKRNKRCSHVEDEPGLEMQHDTSVYKVKISDETIRLVASILYFRYSKMRYLKFYRSFNRFRMKCFLYEALTFFGYSAHECIIDNTNLARLRGTGKNAIIALEMEAFAKQFGFKFKCHEVGHCNRKAGNERSFYTLETNFFPGRSFDNLQDMNNQAKEWATIKMANRPISKTHLIPNKLFEHEKNYLVKLSAHLPPPYIIHKRGIDQYGYISFDGNYYFIPGDSRTEVTVLQYNDSIELYHVRNLLIKYSLPPQDIKNKRFYPPNHKPKYLPRHRKRPTACEEKKLRSLGKEVDEYLNFATVGIQKHKFIRQLYSLYRKVSQPLFINTIKRALKYRITNINTIERIAIMFMSNDITLPCVDINEEFKDREVYLEGRLSDDVDLSIYDKLLED